MSTKLPYLKSIAIIKLGSIGDVIHTLPVSYILRNNFPNSRIDWIIEKKSLEILKGNTYIDNIIVIDTKSMRQNLFNFDNIKSIKKLLRYFSNINYDIVFDFQGLSKSGLIAYLTGSKKKVGFNPSDCREWLNPFFMDVKAPKVQDKTHVVDKNLNLLKFIGINTYPVNFPLTIHNEDEIPIDNFFKEHNITSNDFIVAIDPSAGWKTKCIDLSLLAKVCDYLELSWSCKVILIWGPGEYDKANKIREESFSKPEILCKTTLKSLAAFLKKCNLMISPDTGPLHLAAALGVRCIGIFGPTCPYKNGPYGEDNLVVSKFVDCAPCYKRKCDDIKCINSIKFDDITEKIDFALKHLKKRGDDYVDR
jgi:heptosyltransferase I